jgi:hypothetical protein
VPSIQSPVRKPDSVTSVTKSLDEFIEELMVVSRRHAWDILHHEHSGAQLGHQAQEVENERIARVVQNSMPDQGKALARRAPDHRVDRLAANSSSFPDVVAR